MSHRLFPKLTLAILFVAATVPSFSQVAPAATVGGLPITVGVGLSDYDLDWGYGSRMVGISAYVDWDLFILPGPLRNLSIQAEGNDISYGRPARLPIMRQDTGLGGLKYTYRHYPNLLPYVKYMGGIGSIDFPNTSNRYYTHDTFGVWAPGVGVEYQIWRRLWVRGDYEYQIWNKTFGPRDLTPQGFTIGGSYHFRSTYAHSSTEN
jgi:opacity protein-like surface antigen